MVSLWNVKWIVSDWGRTFFEVFWSSLDRQHRDLILLIPRSSIVSIQQYRFAGQQSCKDSIITASTSFDFMNFLLQPVGEGCLRVPSMQSFERSHHPRLHSAEMILSSLANHGEHEYLSDWKIWRDEIVKRRDTESSLHLLKR